MINSNYKTNGYLINNIEGQTIKSLQLAISKAEAAIYRKNHPFLSIISSIINLVRALFCSPRSEPMKTRTDVENFVHWVNSFAFRFNTISKESSSFEKTIKPGEDFKDEYLAICANYTKLKIKFKDFLAKNPLEKTLILSADIKICRAIEKVFLSQKKAFTTLKAMESTALQHSVFDSACSRLEE